MKILITGATGLVGQEIVRLCNAKGINVHYLTTQRNKITSSSNYQGFYWNPDKDEIDLKCFDGIQGIFNLAGSSISKRWTKSYKQQISSSRTNSLKTLHKALTQISAESIQFFVSASAVGFYPHSYTTFYTEDHSLSDASFLGKVVKTWEEEIDRFKEFNFSVTTIRIGLVLANTGGAYPPMRTSVKYFLGAAFGSGEQWQSWIHLTDLGRIFLFAGKKRINGIVNGVAPNPVTNTKLVREIAKAIDKPLWLPNIPKFMLQILLGQMSYILLVSQRVCSTKLETLGFKFKFKNVNNALAQLEKLEEENAL